MKSVRLLLITALLILPATVIGQRNRSPYLNYEYKGVPPSATLPNGVKHFGGGLIGKIDADPVHGISQVAKGRTKMLWLEVSTGKDAGGITGWRVMDVLAFPALDKNDYLFFSGDPAIFCRRRSAELANLVGVGTINRRQGIFRPSKLWVANLTTEKFELIPLTGVKCEYSEP
jgi:hypothetical protein